jgi:DNA polymerase-3 subunit alpha
MRQLEKKLYDEGFLSSHPLKDWIRYELNFLELHDLDGYVLFLLQKGIKTKGNPNSSSILFVLGVTDVPPIDFIKTVGGSAPDVDTDFQHTRRNEVFDYLQKKYGSGFAHIGTVGYSKAKGILKDVCRIYNIPFDESNRITKLIPDLCESLKDALAESKEFKELYNTSKGMQEIIDLAISLEGTIKSVGIHACGVILDDHPISDNIPVWEAQGQIATQYDGETCEKLGYIKVDILGLKCLSILSKTKDLISENHKIEVDYYSLPLDNRGAYELLHKGDTLGVFQLEGSSVAPAVSQVAPDDIHDISALLSIWRPGPLGMGYDKAYINRKHDDFSDRNFDIPRYTHIFSKTYGLGIYQEQYMIMLQEMCGFDDIKTDVWRKAVGKKQADLLESLHEDFISGGVANGNSKDDLESLWEKMTEFGRYAFNASHSYAYAHLSYYTAWAKANYPHEFFTAVISLEDDPDQKVSYIQNARQNKINVRPPDINFSNSDFSISPDKDIIFGFNGIKGLGPAAITKILELRPFKSFEDFIFKTINERTITSKVIETLINVGAFDSLGYRRSVLVKNYQAYAIEAKNAVAAAIGNIKTKKDKAAALKEVDYSALETVGTTLFKEDFPDYTIIQKLAMEKQYIGIHITGSPFELLKKSIKGIEFYTSQMVTKALDNSGSRELKCQIAFTVSRIKSHVTSSGKAMTFIDGLDANGASLNLAIFMRGNDTKGYEQMVSMLSSDSIYLATVKASISQRGMSLSINSLIDGAPSIEEAFRNKTAHQGLNIYIQNIENSNSWMTSIKRIQSLVSDYPGSGFVRVYVKVGDGTFYHLKSINKIDLSIPFLREIQNLEDVMSELF